MRKIECYIRLEQLSCNSIEIIIRMCIIYIITVFVTFVTSIIFFFFYSRYY